MWKTKLINKQNKDHLAKIEDWLQEENPEHFVAIPVGMKNYGILLCWRVEEEEPDFVCNCGAGDFAEDWSHKEWCNSLH